MNLVGEKNKEFPIPIVLKKLRKIKFKKKYGNFYANPVFDKS